MPKKIRDSLPQSMGPVEPEVLIKVEGLSKKFCKDLKTSLWYGAQDLFSNLQGSKSECRLREHEFWAVKNINFELRRGECLGLIGHNGAGKSTLLKILNGLIKPDAGKVTIKGRQGALIELGAGFNPILTGRENIYNNAAILGFTRKEIEQKLEEIIDFAEIREFIDMPVQNYSSGMKVRLGFAIAAQMEPDVLIIDEVLAVGDLGFVLKCLRTIDRILPRTAIVFVSHSMPMVSRICHEIILLEKGETVFQGKEVAKAIDFYYSNFVQNGDQSVFDDGSIGLLKIELVGIASYVNHIPQIRWGDELKFYFKFAIKDKKRNPGFSIIIVDKEQRPIALLEDTNQDSKNTRDNEYMELYVSHKNIQLSKGIYTVDIVVKSINTKEPFLRINSVISFQVIHDIDVWQPFFLKSDFEIIESGTYNYIQK